MKESEGQAGSKMMIVVAGAGAVGLVALVVVGTLAGVAGSAFSSYGAKSKASEARVNLKILADAATAHYESGTGQCVFPQPAGPLPAKKDCCDDKCETNVAGEGSPGWTALGFDTKTPYRYSYQTARRGAQYIIWAEGDLDCDGMKSHYELVLSPTANCGEVTRSEIQVQREFE